MLGKSCLGLLLLAAGTFVARADDPAKATVEDATPVAEDSAATSTDGAKDGASQTKSDGQKWRFRRHNGRWWYWLPSKRWVVWNGEKWVEPADVAGSTQQRRSYSRSRPVEWGFWGPKYYDRWGNIKYPYSRRRTGIKQLGPVPAMGGVRSLPGWGGER